MGGHGEDVGGCHHGGDVGPPPEEPHAVAQVELADEGDELVEVGAEERLADHEEDDVAAFVVEPGDGADELGRALLREEPAHRGHDVDAGGDRELASHRVSAIGRPGRDVDAVVDDVDAPGVHPAVDQRSGDELRHRDQRVGVPQRPAQEVAHPSRVVAHVDVDDAAGAGESCEDDGDEGVTRTIARVHDREPATSGQAEQAEEGRGGGSRGAERPDPRPTGQPDELGTEVDRDDLEVADLPDRLVGRRRSPGDIAPARHDQLVVTAIEVTQDLGVDPRVRTERGEGRGVHVQYAHPAVPHIDHRAEASGHIARRRLAAAGAGGDQRTGAPMSAVNRNLVWLLISQALTWAMSLVAMLVVPRLLGASSLGSYGFSVAYVGFFGLAIGLGTSTFLVREIARDHSVVPSYLFNATVLKLVLTTVLGGVAMLLGVVLQFSDEVLMLVAIGCIGLYSFALNEVYAGTLIGLQRMGKSSAWTVAAVYLGTIGGIVVLAAGGGVVAFAAILAVSNVLPLFGNWLQLRGVTRGHRRIDRTVMRHLVRGGVPLMLLMVFNQIYTTIDVPILAALTTPTVVGWYVLAYRWAAIPIFIANVVNGSFYPEMSKHGPGGGPEFTALVNRALKLVLVVSVPAGIGLAVVAGDLLHLLYGSEFEESLRPLQILALQLPITCVDTILATALIAQDRLRKYLVVAGVTAALNPPLTIGLVVLTDRISDNGATGAALATALTELFVMSCALVLSAKGVMDRAMVGWTVRCVAAGLTIVVVGLVAGGTPLVVQVVLGVVAFGVAALALRTITVSMLRAGLDQVRSAARRRPVDPGTASGG